MPSQPWGSLAVTTPVTVPPYVPQVTALSLSDPRVEEIHLQCLLPDICMRVPLTILLWNLVTWYTILGQGGLLGGISDTILFTILVGGMGWTHTATFHSNAQPYCWTTSFCHSGIIRIIPSIVLMSVDSSVPSWSRSMMPLHEKTAGNCLLLL